MKVGFAGLTGIFLVFVSAVSAVFSDEAFLIDWQIKQIGEIDNKNLVHQSQNVFNVLTNNYVLGAVEDAQIKWRISFENLNKGSSQRLVSFGEGVVATALNFKDRSSIQIWDAIEGFFVKDLIEFKDELKEIESDKNGNILAVFTNGRVVYIDTLGKVIHENVIEFSQFVAISSFQNGNFAILFEKKNDVFVGFYNGVELTTQLLHDIKYDAIREFDGSKVVYESSGHYNIIKIDTQYGFTNPPIVVPQFDKFITDLSTDEYFALEKNHNLEVYSVAGYLQFTIENVYKYTLKFVNDVFIHYNEYYVIILDVDTGDELQSYFLGDVKLPFDEIDSFIITSNGVDEVDSIINYSNNTYSYYKNEKKIWNRDTATANVLAHTVVDLPVDNTITFDQILYEEQQNLLNAYIFRVKRHFYQLRDLYENFWNFLPGWVTGEFSFAAKKNDRYFGFEKYLILGTKSGRVIALNSLDGSTAWSFNVEQDDILHIENINNERLDVFTSSGPRFILNALTGDLITKNFVSPPKKIVKFEEDDTYLLELQNGFDVVLTDQELLSDKYVVKNDKNTVSGFKVEDKQSRSTWTFETSLDEEIVGFVTKDQEEAIANIGIALGERNVLYKYLYPNLAAVAVLDRKTHILYIHILDTITGEILYTTHHDEQLPYGENVNVAFGEYWVVYSYYSNLPTPEQKIVVLDLFESLIPNERGSTNETTSAFDRREPPAVSSKSFILPSRIKNLEISKTKFGVANKAIIIALENNQIFFLPKFVLNSRRVEGRQLTNTEKTEFQLLPYDPVILIDDNAVITHQREVIAGDAIISVPTNLESTSVVCSYGLDVFCTRISPSAQFDKLTPSFDKGKLIFSIFALAGVIAILRPIVRSRNLKAAWTEEKK